MRSLNVLIIALLVISTTVFTSCATEEETGSPTVETVGDGVFLAFGHQVTDYATWKTAFDAAEEARGEFDVQIEEVLQGEDDPNLVWIIASAPSEEAANAFMVDPSLARSMEMAGVEGEVYRAVLEKGFTGTVDQAQFDTRLIVQHEVRDLDKWKEVFDGHVGSRDRAGVVDLFVTHPIGNPTDVHMMFGISEPTEATTYMSSEALQIAMRLSGVIGEPRAYFLRVAD